MITSFIMNSSILLMVAFSVVAMFINWDFMGKTGRLKDSGCRMFRYFTIDSNILMGACSLIMAWAEIPILMGKSQILPSYIYGIKLMGTSAVTLTFVVTLCFLVPQFKNPMSLFYNSNFFFHLIVPITAIVSFVFIEKAYTLPFKSTLLGVLPAFIYCIYYIIQILTHLDHGKPDKHYDFYNFLNGNIKRAPIAVIVVLGASYLMSVLLWWGATR